MILYYTIGKDAILLHFLIIDVFVFVLELFAKKFEYTKCIKFPCGVCSKSVAINPNALCCDSCDKWVHIKCNFLNKRTYRQLQKDKSPWFCIDCIKDQLPFQSQVNIDQKQQYVRPEECSTLKDLLENLDLDEDCPHSECYAPSEFSDLNLNNTNLFIHLNISSLILY